MSGHAPVVSRNAGRLTVGCKCGGWIGSGEDHSGVWAAHAAHVKFHSSKVVVSRPATVETTGPAPTRFGAGTLESAPT